MWAEVADQQFDASGLHTTSCCTIFHGHKQMLLHQQHWNQLEMHSQDRCCEPGHKKAPPRARWNDT
jgi:hypothetical protein